MKTIQTPMRTHIAFAVFAAFATGASAQDSTQIAEPVNVDVNAQGYGIRSSFSSTKTNTPLIETPVTVNSVSQELILDRQILAPQELANVVSGVQAVQGYGNMPVSDFLIRGFTSQGVNFRDNFRSAESYTPRDMQNIERVDFVKGPASVIDGAIQPGGAVNWISKRAQQGEFANFQLQTGSWNLGRVTADLNGSTETLAARLNFAGNRENSYIDFQNSNNYLIAPTLTWKPIREIELTYAGEFQSTNMYGYSVGLPNMPVQNMSTGTTMSQPWTQNSNYNRINQGELKWKFDEDWTFRQGIYFGNSSMSSPYSLSPGLNNNPYAAGETLTNAWRQYSSFSQQQINNSSQSELYGKFNTGDVGHKLLVGYEYYKTKWNQAAMFNIGGSCLSAGALCYDTMNLQSGQGLNIPQAPGAYTPTYGSYFGLPTLDSFTGLAATYGGPTNYQSIYNSFYLQDQISWDRLRLLVGVRNDRINSTNSSTISTNYNSGLLTDWNVNTVNGLVFGPLANSSQSYNYSYTEGATTGKAGLLYMLAPNASVYYNWSQSFASNAAYSVYNSTPFSPSRGNQNEVGAKWSPYAGLDTTVSLYRINKTNVPVSTGALSYALVGEQVNQGWELSAVGQATSSTRVVGNVSGINAKVTEGNNNFPVNSRMPGVPNFTANLWGVQDIPLGIPGKFSAGIGGVYVGERAAALPNLTYFTLPSYATMDAALFYKYKTLSLALNGKNLTNSTVINTMGPTQTSGNGVVRMPGSSWLVTLGVDL